VMGGGRRRGVLKKKMEPEMKRCFFVRIFGLGEFHTHTSPSYGPNDLLFAYVLAESQKMSQYIVTEWEGWKGS
jgi:hypothetical protein